jgi:hypothetical protein
MRHRRSVWRLPLPICPKEASVALSEGDSCRITLNAERLQNNLSLALQSTDFHGLTRSVDGLHRILNDIQSQGSDLQRSMNGQNTMLETIHQGVKEFSTNQYRQDLTLCREMAGLHAVVSSFDVTIRSKLALLVSCTITLIGYLLTKLQLNGIYALQNPTSTPTFFAEVTGHYEHSFQRVRSTTERQDCPDTS